MGRTVLCSSWLECIVCSAWYDSTLYNYLMLTFRYGVLPPVLRIDTGFPKSLVLEPSVFLILLLAYTIMLSSSLTSVVPLRMTRSSSGDCKLRQKVM